MPEFAEIAQNSFTSRGSLRASSTWKFRLGGFLRGFGFLLAGWFDFCFLGFLLAFAFPLAFFELVLHRCHDVLEVDSYKLKTLSHPRPLLVTARLRRLWSFLQIPHWPDLFGGSVIRQVIAVSAMSQQ